MRANIIAFVLVLVTLLSSAAFADKAITGIDIVNKSDRAVITVEGNSALTMVSIKSTRGQYVGFQFPCKLIAKGRIVGIHGGKIYNIRYSNFSANPAATRIVVNTTGHVDYSTEWSASKDRVEITVWKSGKPKDSAPAARLQTPEPESAVSASVTHLTAKPIARLRTETPVLYASASASAMPVLSARPAEPVTRVLGEVQEITKKTERRPTMLARVAPASAGRLAQDLERRVSLNFLGADINDVLKALSVQSGNNIVASKEVTGNVTVSLSDVTVDQALDYVAKLSGYGYTKDNSTYLVGSKDSLKMLSNAAPDKPKVEVMALNFAKGDDVMALLKNQCADVQVSKSDLKADDKTTGSLLVLSGSEDKVSQAMQLVAKVEESMRAQAGDYVNEVYNLKYVSPFEMRTAISGLVPEVMVSLAPSDGFDLFAPEAVKGAGGDSAGGATIENSKITKKTDELGRIQSLVFTGPEMSVNRAMDLAARLDVKSPQIKFEAKVTSLNKSGEKKLGLTWDWGDFAVMEGFTDSGGTKSNYPDADANQTLNMQNVKRSHGLFARQPFNFGAALDAIVTNGDGELLASPSLTCIEGKPGVFFVGDEVTYIQRIEQTPTGQNIITDAKQVGVQLRVNGDVTSDGFITVNLHPEVSVLKLSVEQGVTLPIVSRRFTDHVVRVKDGQTIVIGGLIRNDEIEEMSKVPVLGDLPFLGNLFRHKSKTTDHTEVVMFITASIIKD
ncbi:MAG: secretin and TonB N-terminal domain-containing protein [Armatimonadota bacterium]